MRKSAFLILALLVLTLAGCTPRRPPPRFTLQGEAPSPRGDLVVQRYADPGGKERQLWLRGREGEPQFLFRYFRIATVVFSPGEDYLVVNDRRAKEEAGLALYRRQAGARFVAVPRLDLEGMVWRRFYGDLHWDLRKYPGFHHDYAWCPGWADAGTLRVRLQGFGDNGLVDQWAYSYNVRTGELSPDPRNSLKYVELPWEASP